jgi:hypothetical protein
MTDLMPNADYGSWLTDLKQRIQSAQQRASLSVNRELVLLYWQIGRDILERQKVQGWGAKVIDQLAHDLTAAFPDMKGFSRRNLLYMRSFAEQWPDVEFVQQAVAQKEESAPPKPAARAAKPEPSTFEQVMKSPVTNTIMREVTRGLLGILGLKTTRRR